MRDSLVLVATHRGGIGASFSNGMDVFFRPRCPVIPDKVYFCSSLFLYFCLLLWFLMVVASLVPSVILVWPANSAIGRISSLNYSFYCQW